jgi:hypothetical protein
VCESLVLQSKVSTPCAISKNISNLKMAVFWNVAPCNLTDIDRRFIKKSNFHTRRCENIKSHLFKIYLD